MSYFKSLAITFEAALADLKDGSEKAQVQAAGALADVTSADDRQQAAEALVARLEDAPTAVRVAVARSLGELGRGIALEPLIRAAESEQPRLRQVAIIALGRLGLREAFDPVAKALASGPADSRFQAARTLVEIDPDRAYEPLIVALESEEDDEVIGAIALALGELGRAEAADPLAPHLENTREETAFEVAYGLSRLADPRAAATLGRFVDTPQFAWDAIEGLERAGGNVAIERLAAAVTSRSRRPELELRAAAALLALAPENDDAPTARAQLIAGLSAWRLHIRSLATVELGRVGGPWALPALRRLRTRRRGAPLLAEIDDALATIEGT